MDCDKITYYKPFTLPGGLRLPLTLVWERITAWEGAAAERTEQSARQEGEQQLLALLSARLPEGSTVTDTRFAAVRQGGTGDGGAEGGVSGADRPDRDAAGNGDYTEIRGLVPYGTACKHRANGRGHQSVRLV